MTPTPYATISTFSNVKLCRHGDLLQLLLSTWLCQHWHSAVSTLSDCATHPFHKSSLTFMTSLTCTNCQRSHARFVIQTCENRLYHMWQLSGKERKVFISPFGMWKTMTAVLLLPWDGSLWFYYLCPVDTGWKWWSFCYSGNTYRFILVMLQG